MTIGIIVAMTKELNLLLPLMENPEVQNTGGTEFHLEIGRASCRERV